jgi:SAM-dependent methyltransferase
MNPPLEYVGRDLEAMSFAANYHRGILDIFKPYLGKRVVEVGAGTGSFSEFIIEHHVESLSLVEPSEYMYEILKARLEELKSATPIQTFNSIFTEVADRIKATQQPDSIIYVNVLEHIADDTAELDTMFQTLERGGRIFVFVPALPWLSGSFDHQIGHFRRYKKSELESKCRKVGFRVIKSGYFDFIGVIPWWVKYRLLKSTMLESSSVKLYDKWVVPVIRVVEPLIRPPIGKNAFLVAEKV